MEMNAAQRLEASRAQLRPQCDHHVAPDHFPRLSRRSLPSSIAVRLDEMARVKHLMQDLTSPGCSTNLNSLSFLPGSLENKHKLQWILHWYTFFFKWKKNRNYTHCITRGETGGTNRLKHMTFLSLFYSMSHECQGLNKKCYLIF